MSHSPAIVCPFCGAAQPASGACIACGTSLDAETRRETLARMGPWFIRSERLPFMPGCSWQQLAELVARGVIDRHSILRGPTTRQLWTVAVRVPGVAHLVGSCHACGAKVSSRDAACPACRVSFGAPLERDSLGLADDAPRSVRAHDDDDDQKPLSSFASNDELREGLHDEVRRRRSLRMAIAPDPAGGAALAVVHAGTDPWARAIAWIDERRSKLLLALGAMLALAVLTWATLALLPEPRGRSTSGAARRPATAPAAAAPARTLQGDAPASSAGATPAPADPSAAMAPPSPPSADPAAPRSTAASAPAAAPARDPLSAALATIDDLIRRARDGSLARADRRAALDEAASLLASAANSAPAADSKAGAEVAARRERIDEERRRLAAESFLRGDDP